MMKHLILIIFLVFQFSCSSSGEKKPSSKKTETQIENKNVVDPEAIAQVEKMGKYLRGIKKFEIDSDATFDIVLENEQKTEFGAHFHYKVRRPNKLFAEIKSERKHRKYFYDGKKFTIFAPKENFFGEFEFKGTVGELVKKLNDFGIEVPLSDLFVWGTDEAKADKMTSAIFLNEEHKGNHLAFRQDKIDWQVWIQKGKHPLPKKVQYEVNDDTARPKTTATLDWNTNPSFGDSVFDFKPSKGSQKIKLNPARKPEEKK